VQQFEDRRKKKVLRKYYKELKYIQGDIPKNTELTPSEDTTELQLPKERYVYLKSTQLLLLNYWYFKTY
jgi:hypothetical protein